MLTSLSFTITAELTQSFACFAFFPPTERATDIQQVWNIQSCNRCFYIKWTLRYSVDLCMLTALIKLLKMSMCNHFFSHLFCKQIMQSPNKILQHSIWFDLNCKIHIHVSDKSSRKLKWNKHWIAYVFFCCKFRGDMHFTSALSCTLYLSSVILSILMSPNFPIQLDGR